VGTPRIRKPGRLTAKWLRKQIQGLARPSQSSALLGSRVRKAELTALAEASTTPHEIMAVTGHQKTASRKKDS
jgi:hypothetical protein